MLGTEEPRGVIHFQKLQLLTFTHFLHYFAKAATYLLLFCSYLTALA